MRVSSEQPPGHAAVAQLGLSALASVAEAPQADCAAAIASRPGLRAVLLAQQERRLAWRKGVRTHMAFINEKRCTRVPMYSHGMRRSVAQPHGRPLASSSVKLTPDKVSSAHLSMV